MKLKLQVIIFGVILIQANAQLGQFGGNSQQVASWNYCMNQQITPCPNVCIQSGYTSDQNSTLCLPPQYSFCYGITDACNSNSPNYLKACTDYGFYNDTNTDTCQPPTCIDEVNPCPTVTTYCFDFNYTNINGTCGCHPPQLDWLGQCTDATFSLKLIGFFSIVVILAYPFF
ncbi:hypothetical protein ABPG72_016024 [Tetrahymena utriculariae]